MIEGLSAVSRRSGISGPFTPREGGVPTGLGIAPPVAVSMAVALLRRGAPPGSRSARAGEAGAGGGRPALPVWLNGVQVVS